MREENAFYDALKYIGTHPVTYGVLAGVARFAIGDRTAGWRSFMTNIGVSAFVAASAMLYLADEPYTDAKKLFFTSVASFLARDLLVALVAIGGEFSRDPTGFLVRLREAFKGNAGKDGPK